MDNLVINVRKKEFNDFLRSYLELLKVFQMLNSRVLGDFTQGDWHTLNSILDKSVDSMLNSFKDHTDIQQKLKKIIQLEQCTIQGEIV